ncbi:hypothetical protein LINPERHAP2_LOCUS4634, partial [Linum perenne]
MTPRLRKIYTMVSISELGNGIGRNVAQYSVQIMTRNRSTSTTNQLPSA